MPETDKQEENLNGSSDMHEPAAKGEMGPEEPAPSHEAEPAPAEGDAPSPEGLGETAAEAPDEEGISEFADNVVLGLEQAGLGIEEHEPLETAQDESGLVPGAAEEAFFADWAGFEDFAENGPAGQPEQEQEQEQEQEPASLNELSDSSLASWGASEGLDEIEIPPQAEAHTVSLQSLSSMGSARLVFEESPMQVTPQQAGLRTLSEMSLASAGAFAGYNGFGEDASKHDELADAVQSALLSVYGEAPEQTAQPIFQKPAISEEPSSMGWNARPATGLAQPSDGLTPQDVILNYFDYTPGAQDGSDSAPQAFDPDAAYEKEPPVSFRPGPESVAQLQKRWDPEDRPTQPQEWKPTARPAQYSGPPSFPVPAQPGLAQKPAAPQKPESSRLLGAAAIGLMGGIAIAASLAAFLIYGPHPAGVEIPGIGSLRLDKDDQGYGRAIPEESNREPLRSPGIKAPAESSSEVLAADAVAVAGQPAPLAISIRSSQAFEKTLVSITGVPEGGRLSAGVDTGGGAWLLPPRRLNGLTINLPAGLPDLITLEAQLLDSNARTPLSAKGSFIVRLKPATPGASDAFSQGLPPATLASAPKPVSQPSPAYSFNTQTVPQPAAPAQTQTADSSFRAQTVTASPLPQTASAPFQASLAPAATAPGRGAARNASPRPEVEDLIREGNKRMREGDILEARQFYQRAVSFGDPEAALAMGRSYDPIYFARIDKKNAEPDAAKAFDWYRKAMDAGAAQTAMVRIENLKHFLNE
ncbi:MAG: hypothetical protein ACLQF2_11520 [Rhodomicrobium sp.]